jgi:IS5 family transposase
MKLWFGAGRARYKGLAKTHTQHLLEAIAYNLYRAPGIILANAEKH